MAFLLISFWYDLILCIVLLSIACYYAARKRYSYWTNKGIHSPKPVIPFGNVSELVAGSKQIGVVFADIYNETKQHPYVGAFMALNPTLVVNDLDLSKLMLTKDFVHFSEHGFPFDEEHEPLTGHLFNVGGVKWKNLRAKLTPTFTSNRMKYMYDIVYDCSREMSDHLVKNTGDLDVKEVLACFGNDVIASCAFGIECNTFRNPDDMFRKMGKRIFKPTLLENLFNLLDFLVPNVFTKWKAKLNGKDVEKFFCKTVEDTVNYREKNGIVRNDFMQLLIQLKNTGSVSEDDKSEAAADDGTRLTMMQLAAQVFVFFIAGFETSSTTASFALYELALNPDVQKELADEIDETMTKYDGKLTYDSLGEMTFLTKVIEETMRKYPPLPVIFRICTKDYVLPDTDIKIEKDTPVMIPVYGIQRDPDIYPNPDKFDPERFSPENKASRHHFAYLPFGEGPRICIGSRFGMMQTKLGLATFLSKYEVSVCEKTLIPMVYDKRSFILTSDGGLYLKITRRSK